MPLILFIDDDLGSLERLVYTFRNDLNFSVVEQFNTIEPAIEFIKGNETEIDYIFIDERMPEISGRELGKELFKKEIGLYVPWVMLTAHKEFNYAIEALTKCGFDYFIWKNEFASNEEINQKIKEVDKIPSVRLKRRLKYSENRISKYIDDINKEKLTDYFNNFDACIIRDKSEKY